MENKGEVRETTTRRKKPSIIRNFIKGIGFWIVVIAIFMVIGFTFKSVTSQSEKIGLINTKSEAVQLNFVETQTGKEYSTLAGSETVTDIKVKNGSYDISVLKENGETIRTLNNITVSGEGFDESYIDVHGDTGYIIMDITYLYEGNEALEKDSYVELDDGSGLIIIPYRTITIGPFDRIPPEIDNDKTAIAMIPVTASEQERLDDALWNDIVIKYFNERVE